MKKNLILLLTLLTFISHAQQPKTIILKADTSRSSIHWKGTKMMNSGKHEGTIGLKQGSMTMHGDRIHSGHFVIDMNDITITDIPPFDKEPIRNLTNHLKSDFETATFKTATFTLHPGSIRNACGALTIKGITKTICITTTGTARHFTAAFTINRSDFKIGARGSWLERRLVDEQIYLCLDIYLE